MTTDEKLCRAYVQVDLDAIKNNYKYIRSSTKAKVCCVVKANAYGHGAVELARIYEDMGADFLAVSNIEEALQLRYHKIALPILVLGYTPVACVDLLSSNNISQCIYSKSYGYALYEEAKRKNLTVKIHIKLDTGMGRIGFLCRDEEHNELKSALKIAQLPNLLTEGIFTHFAIADEGENGEAYTKQQFNCFMRGVKFLEGNGIHFDIRHCANSASIFDYPEFHLDMVRAGIVLYGMNPSNCIKSKLALKPAMSFISVVSNVKKIHTGESISYGRTFISDSEKKVATVPVGYADGFWRSNGNENYSLIINGKEATILGRVCMDQLMVDVTDIECNIGDKVLIWGNVDNHSVDYIALLNNTINYEIVCAIGERVPRVYISNGRIVKWESKLLN